MLAETSTPTAASAGITAAGWRASAPFFGRHDERALLAAAPCRSWTSTWIQKFAAASAKAAKVYEPAPASAAVVSATAK